MFYSPHIPDQMILMVIFCFPYIMYPLIDTVGQIVVGLNVVEKESTVSGPSGLISIVTSVAEKASGKKKIQKFKN